MNHAEYIQRLKTHQGRIEGSCSECSTAALPNVDCSCRKRFIEVAAYIKADIPEKYWDLDLAAVSKTVSKQAKDAAISYLSQLDHNLRNGRGAYISSTFHQSGKSTVAYIIMKAAIQSGYTAAKATLSDCASVMSNKDADTEAHDFLVSRVMHSDLLVIDNLGDFATLVGAPGFLKTSLSEVYRTRANNNQATIITSSLPQDKITDVFGLPFDESLRNSAEFITLTNKSISTGV